MVLHVFIEKLHSVHFQFPSTKPGEWSGVREAKGVGEMICWNVKTLSVYFVFITCWTKDINSVIQSIYLKSLLLWAPIGF